MRHTRCGFIAMTARGFMATAALGALLGLPAGAQAQRSSAQITSLYMTTEQAYDAYASNSPAAPKVTAFPQGVDNVGVFFDYQGVRAHKTTYRVAFFQHGTEVRHGAVHTFGYANGWELLRIPADELQAMGSYKATLYVGNAATLSTAFSVIRTPTIDSAYMITAGAWNAFAADPNGAADPPRATRFPSGVASVGAYFSYSGMARADKHYVAVYDARDKQMHRSKTYGAGSYVPGGSIAIILPADSGNYPKGKYRTDLYVNGAMVKSIAWTAR